MHFKLLSVSITYTTFHFCCLVLQHFCFSLSFFLRSQTDACFFSVSYVVFLLQTYLVVSINCADTDGGALNDPPRSRYNVRMLCIVHRCCSPLLKCFPCNIYFNMCSLLVWFYTLFTLYTAVHKYMESFGVYRLNAVLHLHHSHYSFLLFIVTS